MMKQQTVGAFIVALGILASATVSLANDDVAEQQKLKQAQSNEVPIEFYGRVVDQFDEPVGSAEVKAHVQRVGILYVWEPPPVNYLAKTDAQGRFVLPPTGTIVSKGLSLYFDSIRKDGYEQVRDEAFCRNYEYANGSRTQYVADKSRPVVFQLRKKGEVVALLEEPVLEFTIPTAGSGKAVGYDFIQRHRIRDVAKPSGDDRSLVCDLQVKATFNANDAAWEVVLSPGNTNGGIIVSGQLLYEAPGTGYEAEYTFMPDDRKPIGAKYIYLKSRDPAIYTRMEVKHVLATKEVFQLDLTSVTNPYGERNLEQATDLPIQVRIQLADDAKAAFRQGKRPLKPDLPKLIKDAKEKADKTTAKP